MSTPLLQTKDLQLAFGAVVVADHIDFSLNEGERLAVIGQNGAGKTTFINICTGLIHPQAGQVFFRRQRSHRARAASDCAAWHGALVPAATAVQRTHSA